MGFIFIVKAVFCFCIAINIFNNTYPTFIDANLWDSLVFILSEFLPSLILGYSKPKNEIKANDLITLENFDLNKNTIFNTLPNNKFIFENFKDSEMLREPLIA